MGRGAVPGTAATGATGMATTSATGSQTSRTLAWSGASELDVDLAADVRYVQSAGPASVVATRAAARLVERVVIVGDSIRHEHGRRHAPKLTIVVTAPNITSFDLSGRNTLVIEGYRQETKIDVSGEAEVTATGQAARSIDLSGEGDVDLGALKTKGASVEISGDADATIAHGAPLGQRRRELVTTPKQVETDISGSPDHGTPLRSLRRPRPRPRPRPPQAPRPEARPPAASRGEVRRWGYAPQAGTNFSATPLLQ